MTQDGDRPEFRYPNGAPTLPESSFNPSLTEIEAAQVELESRIESASGRQITERERLGIQALIDAVWRAAASPEGDRPEDKCDKSPTSKHEGPSYSYYCTWCQQPVRFEMALRASPERPRVEPPDEPSEEAKRVAFRMLWGKDPEYESAGTVEGEVMCARDEERWMEIGDMLEAAYAVDRVRAAGERPRVEPPDEREWRTCPCGPCRQFREGYRKGGGPVNPGVPLENTP